MLRGVLFLLHPDDRYEAIGTAQGAGDRSSGPTRPPEPEVGAPEPEVGATNGVDVARFPRMAKHDAFTDHLASVPLFSACSKKDLQIVAKRAEDVRVDAGKVLVSEGAAGAEFFVIIEGTAKVSRHGQDIATLGPGQFFGDLALLDHAPRNATVTAATPLELVVLGQREFSGLIDEVPGFAHKLLAGLAGRLRAYDAQTVQ